MSNPLDLYTVACCIPTQYNIPTYPGNQDVRHAVDLVTYYRQSEQYQHVQEKLQPLLDDLTEREMTEGFTVNSNRAAYATNFFWQVLNKI